MTAVCKERNIFRRTIETARTIKKGLRWEANSGNIKDVPSRPGVYVLYYYGKRRYVGKSKNIHGRLMQHYNDPHTRFTEFTWCQTIPPARHTLETALIDKDLPEFWNKVRGRTKRS